MTNRSREERRLRKACFRIGTHVDAVRREVERLPEHVRRHNAAALMRLLNSLAGTIDALRDVELPPDR